MNKADADRIWTEEWTHDIQLINEVIRRLDLDRKSKILDVGTGQGIMAISLAAAGFEVLTGEPEEGSEDPANYDHEAHGEHYFLDWREAARTAGVTHKVEYRRFNAESLPFQKESFDAVFLYDALQHIRDRVKALNECIRVVKRGGVVCAIEANNYGIDYFGRTEGIVIEKVDPREMPTNEEVAIQMVSGEYSDAYLLKRLQ